VLILHRLAESKLDSINLFECMKNILKHDNLAAVMFGKCDCVAKNFFQSHPDNSTKFVINKTAYRLDSGLVTNPSDSRFCDALNIIAQNFAMLFTFSCGRVLGRHFYEKRKSFLISIKNDRGSKENSQAKHHRKGRS
jgi:hypothetical protein